MTEKQLSELFVPITRDNIYQLEPGEWIWDSATISRRVHKQTLSDERVTEPIGFRQVDILDLKLWPRWSSTPFTLSNTDTGRSFWTYFEEGRFFMFKR